MTAPPQTAPAVPPRPKPTRAQRIVAFMFLAAFGMTLLTVILTGLYVRSPSSRRALETPAVTLTLDEPHTINLVFAARAPLADVEFTIDLPAGVELAERPGERRVTGHAELAAGSNALPVTIVARGGSGGQLAARLRSGADQRTFVVDLTLAQP
jgi:hypothetical protein